MRGTDDGTHSVGESVHRSILSLSLSLSHTHTHTHTHTHAHTHTHTHSLTHSPSKSSHPMISLAVISLSISLSMDPSIDAAVEARGLGEEEICIWARRGRDTTLDGWTDRWIDALMEGLMHPSRQAPHPQAHWSHACGPPGSSPAPASADPSRPDTARGPTSPAILFSARTASVLSLCPNSHMQSFCLSLPLSVRLSLFHSITGLFHLTRAAYPT